MVDQHLHLGGAEQLGGGLDDHLGRRVGRAAHLLLPPGQLGVERRLGGALRLLPVAPPEQTQRNDQPEQTGRRVHGQPGAEQPERGDGDEVDQAQRAQRQHPAVRLVSGQCHRHRDDEVVEPVEDQQAGTYGREAAAELLGDHHGGGDADGVHGQVESQLDPRGAGPRESDGQHVGDGDPGARGQHQGHRDDRVVEGEDEGLPTDDHADREALSRGDRDDHERKSPPGRGAPAGDHTKHDRRERTERRGQVDEVCSTTRAFSGAVPFPSHPQDTLSPMN